MQGVFTYLPHMGMSQYSQNARCVYVLTTHGYVAVLPECKVCLTYHTWVCRSTPRMQGVFTYLPHMGMSQYSHGVAGSVVKHHGESLPSGLRQWFFSYDRSLLTFGNRQGSVILCCCGVCVFQLWHVFPDLDLLTVPAYSRPLVVNRQLALVSERKERKTFWILFAAL